MNAWCPHRMVGACSGAAAAVTAGQVDFAVAVDTLGSVAVPAAYCGAFAFRFTHHPQVCHPMPPTRMATPAALARLRAEQEGNPLKAALAYPPWR
jgi:Asp-tRNA(Asn)/Glu-tRNA(Gln) amidotransferase A subunit family amidase